MKEKIKSFFTWLIKWLFSSMEIEPGQKKVHHVKCECEFFKDVIEGYKPFEVRKNDRDYKPGDDMVLREWNKETSTLTGREHRVTITYMLEGYPGIEPGYCILGIIDY